MSNTRPPAEPRPGRSRAPRGRLAALAFGLVVSLALVAGWWRFGRSPSGSPPPGAFQRQPNGRLLLRVSHEQEIWRAGALFLADPRPDRSPLRPEVDVAFPPLRHGLANLERVAAFPPPAHNVFTSSRGFRTKEFGWAKPAGVLRVVVLGASVAYGLAVDPDRTFSAGLERALATAAGAAFRVEVLNLGAPGMTLARVVDLYEGMASIKLFFLPGRAGRWTLADLPVAQTFAELAGRTRVFFTYAPDLARYRRVGDPPDLYVTPR